MLFDPRWQKTTKADPLTLEALIAWLELHPAEMTYCYEDTGRCLAARYNASIGREYNVVPLAGRDTERFDYRLEDVACGSSRTYGAALERARAAASQLGAGLA